MHPLLSTSVVGTYTAPLSIGGSGAANTVVPALAHPPDASPPDRVKANASVATVPETVAAMKPVPALVSKPRRKRSKRAAQYTVEYINDSGAGRTLCSARALTAQGVPQHVISAATGSASTLVTFDTAGGLQHVEQSIGIQSTGLGVAEAYMLKDSPIAVSLGETVLKRRLPFI